MSFECIDPQFRDGEPVPDLGDHSRQRHALTLTLISIRPLPTVPGAGRYRERCAWSLVGTRKSPVRGAVPRRGPADRRSRTALSRMIREIHFLLPRVVSPLEKSGYHPAEDGAFVTVATDGSQRAKYAAQDEVFYFARCFSMSPTTSFGQN